MTKENFPGYRDLCLTFGRILRVDQHFECSLFVVGQVLNLLHQHTDRCWCQIPVAKNHCVGYLQIYKNYILFQPNKTINQKNQNTKVTFKVFLSVLAQEVAKTLIDIDRNLYNEANNKLAMEYIEVLSEGILEDYAKNWTKQIIHYGEVIRIMEN